MQPYNFIILGKTDSIYKISFKEMIDHGAIYVPAFEKKQNKFLNFLQKIHLSTKVYKFLNIPFKSFWVNRILKEIPHKENIVFILFGEWIQIEKHVDLISILRKKHPSCKIVWFAQDLIKTISDLYTKKPIDIAYYKKKCDLVVSYDKKDAIRYGLQYHPTVLSNIHFKENHAPKYDVYFLARYKGRLNTLINLCKKFNQSNLKCGFYIFNVPKEKQIQIKGIYYIEKPLSYEENLKITVNSKCLLELIQEDSVGWTFRTSEALIYKKKLITNNKEIINAPFYNKDNILLLTGSENDLKGLQSFLRNPSQIIYENYESVTPKHFESFLTEELNK